MGTVAVIGTGPSGLAAAKSLIEHGLQPTVFEAAANPGGMWAAPGRGAWSSSARTNLSFYSCAFSDFAWPGETEVFPYRNAIQGYLARYAEHFDLLGRVAFGRRVAKVGREPDGRWRVEYREGGIGGVGVHDNVVIATGFFSQPYVPAFPGLDDYRGAIFHSRDCDSPQIFQDRFQDKRVLVVGAAFSGTEIATKLVPFAKSIAVTFRHPMWFVPRWIKPSPEGRRHPVDLVFYNRRNDNPLIRNPRQFLGEVAGDPGLASPELAFDREVEPPLTIVIADEFLGQVKSGQLAVKRSNALRFDATGVTFSDNSRQNFDAVVMCTGFTSALPFFDADILDTISFAPQDQLQPTLLHRHMFHPDLPGLAFIGHYRGPYLSIMELQSRWLAGILAGDMPLPSAEAMQEGIEAERRQRHQFPRPQFPHGDFVSLADGLAREIGAYPNLGETDPLRPYIESGPVVPAHYRLVGPHAKPEQAAAAILSTLTPILRGGSRPIAADAPAARVFGLLQGTWSIERSVDPGGRFAGTAEFRPVAKDCLHYRESGDLTVDDGQVFASERSYLYKLCGDIIEVWFYDGAVQGEHFIDLEFPSHQGRLWPLESIGEPHFCRFDQYEAFYRLEADDLFHVTYHVSGPRKGYSSRSTFRRTA